MLPPEVQVENKVANCETLKDTVEALEALLSGGFSVWEDGTLYNVRQLVERVNGLKIEIYPREHPPPHFHVLGGDIDASFSITDCSLIKGKIGRRDKELIQWWHNRCRTILINTWNETRPSDCPVGPIHE